MGRLTLALAVALVSTAVGCQGDRDQRVVRNQHRSQRDPGAPIRPATPPGGSKAANGTTAAPSAPAGSPPGRRPRVFTAVSGPGYKGYVRPAYGIEQWEPGSGDIAALETELAAESARARARGDVPGDMDLSSYTRQYFGYRKDGARFIEVSFFCPQADHLAWQDVYVEGGGSCYPIAAYDVTRRSFLYFRLRQR